MWTIELADEYTWSLNGNILTMGGLVGTVEQLSDISFLYTNRIGPGSIIFTKRTDITIVDSCD
jgi:hypothetical protein